MTFPEYRRHIAVGRVPDDFCSRAVFAAWLFCLIWLLPVAVFGGFLRAVGDQLSEAGP